MVNEMKQFPCVFGDIIRTNLHEKYIEVPKKKREGRRKRIENNNQKPNKLNRNLERSQSRKSL